VKRVLVPLDGTTLSEAALPVGDDFASRMGAALELMTICSPGIDQLADRMYLEKLATRCTAACTTTVVASDDAVDKTIASMADDDTLICIGAHGHTGIRLTLPSVSEPLVRRLSTPVLLVGPEVKTPSPRGPVVVCLGWSEIGDAAVTPAAEVANALHVGLELYHVSRGVDGAWMRERLQRVAASVAGPAVWVVVGDGAHTSVAHSIADHARVTDASMLALATHSRSGVDRLVYGSTAQHVVHHAPCPVLVVHEEPARGRAAGRDIARVAELGLPDRL
jgi:nucleotide-binding universal stress UspA family protein